MHQGRVPLQTLRADVDYGFTEAHTTLGRIGVKVWIYRGDIFPAVAPVEEAMEVAGRVAAKGATMADVVANMTDVQAKDTAEGVVEIKKSRVRKKAESSTTETKIVEEIKSDTIAETKKATKPRVKKAEITQVKVESDEKPPVRARTLKPKVEETKETKAVKPKTDAEKEDKAKSKKE